MRHQNKAILGIFKTAETSKGVVIEGWANKAVFDRAGDIINKSAWKLDNFQKNAIILFNHDKSKPIGKALVTEARDDGLYVKARISQSGDPEISRVRDLIKEGILNAFSVGFDCIEAEPGDHGKTEIKQAELFEISVVSLPCNQDSLFNVTKRYDYDELKAAVIKAAEDKPEDKPEDETEDKPADDMPEDEPKPELKADGVELEVQSLILPKDKFPTLDDAKKWATDNGWSADDVEEKDEGWVITQRPLEEFAALTDLKLDDGVMAIVGMCKPEAVEPEDESETEDDGMDKTKQAGVPPTEPMPPHAPEINVPESIALARQANVLMAQVVGELQALREAVSAKQNGVEPKAPEVPQATPPPAAPAPDAVKSVELLDSNTEVIREYLQVVRKTLDRIGA